MLRYAIIGSTGGRQVAFSVALRNDARRPRRMNLKAICGPGDDGKPVITIMMPDED